MPETTKTITVCADSELPKGSSQIVDVGEEVSVGVFRSEDGELWAIEDRCSHDDGPLAHGEFDAAACTVECPRHGALFDLKSGKPRTLPAYMPVRTFEVRVENGEIKLEV